MANRNTSPTLIVDKNGKRNTVHKRIDSSVASRAGRLGGASSMPVPSRNFVASEADIRAASPSALADSTVLTDAQQSYFQNSQALDGDQPVKVYHGSRVEFDSFNPKMLGQGNDTWGNGFYFTDQESIASGYAADSGSDTANVKEFYLNITNPMYVDGKEKMSLVDVRFSSREAANILKQHPDAYMQPNNDNGDMSFLGDYSPRYWDKETHTKQEIDRMIDEVAAEYFSDGSWIELEGVYGKENGSEFLHAVRDVTGHDGVIVDFGDDGKHYVAWFPEQMKLTSNLNPTDATVF